MQVDGTRVAHERLDDEVIVIDLESGAYYSLRGSAADAWTLLAAGHPTDAVPGLLAARWGVDVAAVTGPFTTLLDVLVTDGLLAPGSGEVPPASDDLLVDAPRGAYKPPVVEKFVDMEELLLLDPIHEVDATGWPNLPAES